MPQADSRSITSKKTLARYEEAYDALDKTLLSVGDAASFAFACCNSDNRDCAITPDVMLGMLALLERTMETARDQLNALHKVGRS